MFHARCLHDEGEGDLAAPLEGMIETVLLLFQAPRCRHKGIGDLASLSMGETVTLLLLVQDLCCHEGEGDLPSLWEGHVELFPQARCCLDGEGDRAFPKGCIDELLLPGPRVQRSNMVSAFT